MNVKLFKMSNILYMIHNCESVELSNANIILKINLNLRVRKTLDCNFTQCIRLHHFR